MERPTKLHYSAVKRILRYVKDTLDYGLPYARGTCNYILSGFSDSDLAGNNKDRMSTGGMVFHLNDNLITWVSHKQRCVALSSCEDEFMAATAAAFSHRLGKESNFHGRSKHIDIRYHFIREFVERGEIELKHVSTNEQKADVLTKALGAVKFESMRDLLGMKKLFA
ncbi:secreted RxLR effector protein 161-like [Apium graveolens]|uniref:secreted RxLR effector protein 161-like n=1 Tax=Apium graveolens TaxID=4045 RepID=UPI003D7B9438